MVAFSCSIHKSGRHQGLPIYEDYFPTLAKGSRTSIKATVLMEFPGGALCRSWVNKREFRLVGDIPKHTGTLTLLNVSYQYDHRGSVLTIDDDSWVLPIRSISAQSLMELTETCTGIGALGLGAEYAGWQVVAGNELQPKMAEVLKAYSQGQVVEGSIEHLQVVAELHAVSGGSTSFAFGFSCQPFSRAGDKQGGSDLRSMTLPWGLWTSYMLNCPVVVMECVSEAPKYPFVKLALQQFEEISHHVKSEVVLELNSMLPARRSRWWCVYTASWIGKITLPELPVVSPKPTVSDMFEQLPVPSSEVIQQMTLQDYEIRGLSQSNASLDQAVVNLLEPLPTALHSWANQFHACPCECRNTSLSTTRLSTKGFFGVLVSFADPTGQLCYRHLTPQEVGLLNGVPLILGKHPNSRLEMAAIGQIASPVQSAWIFSAIRRHVCELGFSHLPRINLRDPLEAICRQLFRIRKDLWPNLPISVVMNLYEKNLISLFDSTNDGLNRLQGEDPVLQESDGISNVKDTQVVSPTLPWTSVPGAIPGFSSGSLDLAKDPFHQSITRSRSRSPRKTEKSSAAILDTQPRQVESISKPEAVGSIPSPTPEVETPCLGAVNMASIGAPPHVDFGREDVGQDHQKAWDFLRSPPKVSGIIDESSQRQSPQALQKAFFQLGIGLSPADLLNGNPIIVDFRHNQFSTLTLSESAKIGDIVQAERSLGNPEVVCRDVFGESLASSVKVNQHQAILLCPSDLADRFPESSNMTRCHSVFTQGASVADDEMDFYLQSISNCRKVAMVRPLTVSYLEDIHIFAAAWFADIQCLVSQQSVVSAILFGQHWIPIFVECQSNQIVVHTTSEGLEAWNVLGMDLQFLSPVSATPLMKAFDKDCGFQTFAWLVSKTFGETEPTIFMPAFAKQWRVLFWIFLIMHPSKAHKRSAFALGGHNAELHTAVATILREHGVPLDQAANRAGQVITALGSDRIAQCLKEARPWASLKQLANQQNPPLRLILPSELQKLVEARGARKQPVGNKNNKVEDGAKPNKCIVLPSDVIVPAGVFSQQDGAPISHIPSSQVGSNSRGLVILSESEFEPFAKQTIISTEGLGFAILDPSPGFVEQFGGLVRFPARCAANGEPMLITAALVQKGQKHIQRATPPQLPSVVEVPVVTVKLLLYRDQCTVPWTTVLEGPIKHLMKLAPCLSVCRLVDCQCPATHVTSSESSEPILDLWNRDYVSLQFRKTSAKDAEIFTCHVRILESVFEALTNVSGISGLFVEPREANGRGHCPKHHTVWLPKASHSEAMQMKQQAKASVFVVRVAQRYGLKTSVAKADVIHEQFRHDTPFLAGLTTTYVIGPLPWGCTRQTLQKLISSWNWPAKAIQPAGRSADGRGILWHAQASQAPQHPVITMSHGDVLIVAKDNQVTKPPVVAIEASSHTKECLSVSSKDLKPLKSDPWAAAATHLPGRHPPGLSHVQVQQLEERIDRKLAQIDGDTPMHESLEPRVKALEDQIARLNDAQHHQVATTQALTQQVTQVQQQVEQQGAQFRNHLDCQLADQMSKIEALLSKRPRNE